MSTNGAALSILSLRGYNLSTAEIAASVPRNKALRIWLWSLAALIFIMAVVGGATRLTESGLSITEWKPISGIVPPLNDADWHNEFEHYKLIPQYSEVFPNMDLNGFKFIFFWEWSHRLLGRMIGAATFLPLVFFWAKGFLSNGLKVKLLAVLALGGLQGFIGWWMVQSGLSGRVEVAQERLALHLLLASITFAAIVWIASSLDRRDPALDRPPPVILRFLASLTVLAVLSQICLGGLVAGLRAGRAYNTWPLMDGMLVPPLNQLTALTPIWRNFADNMLMVQFQHRMMAYGLLILAIFQASCASYLMKRGIEAQRAAAIVCLVMIQAMIGIITLLYAVPLWAGLLHQAFAMIVLGTAVFHAQSLRGAVRANPEKECVIKR
jgi:cytochrome c oxidase assembly protein subunit 15